MWFPALLILFSVGAAVGEEDECLRQVYDKCNIASVKSEIPDTIEDLKRDCGVVRDSIKCLDEESGKCTALNDAFDLTYFKKLAQFIETNCDEEKPLYQALSRNYKCIQPTEKNIGDQCRLSEEEFEEMINLVSKEEEFQEKAKFCQRALYDITCNAHVIGTQCGQEAKDAVTEILQNIRGDFQYCNEESILSKLQPFKEVFEAALNKALEGENGHA